MSITVKMQGGGGRLFPTEFFITTRNGGKSCRDKYDVIFLV